jgi:hypothetical protein
MYIGLKVPKTQAHISCTETGESLISVFAAQGSFYYDETPATFTSYSSSLSTRIKTLDPFWFCSKKEIKL